MGDNRHGGNHGGQGHGGGHGGQHGGGQGGGQGDGHGHDKPTDLGQKVDWMTYSHQQLWEMINTGVDLKAAGSAQADWAAVGKALGEVQELLAKAIGQSTQAWTGESAERAREALESVEKWALNTSEHADNVAKCIATEIDHVQTAREMMPPPAPAPPVVTPVAGAAVSPVATPTPVAAPRSPLITDRMTGSGSYAAPHDGSLASTPSRTAGAFTGIDTIAAPAVDSVVTADATHRQAAEVMAMFQMNSYEVDRTVPSFSPPTNPVAPTPPPVVSAPTPHTTDTGSGGGGAGPVVVNNAKPAPAGAPQRPGPTPAQSGRGGFTGNRSGFGGGRGTSARRPPAPSCPATAPRSSRRRGTRACPPTPATACPARTRPPGGATGRHRSRTGAGTRW
ncbi:PPE domain-containing protein, partial [Actinosynnema sp. NPDC023658]|uniref:PPE domain-containing protein n=1 Tax=Actinosynnema sp. NPDC023658 TaxID=3155465 RepID=UPI0033C15984